MSSDVLRAQPRRQVSDSSAAKPAAIASFIRFYLNLGATPGDRQSVRVAKAQVIGSTSCSIVVALVFGLIYLSYRELGAGIVGISCGILMAANIALFVLMHRNVEFAFTINATLAFLGGLVGLDCPWQLR